MTKYFSMKKKILKDFFPNSKPRVSFIEFTWVSVKGTLSEINGVIHNYNWVAIPSRGVNECRFTHDLYPNYQVTTNYDENKSGFILVAVEDVRSTCCFGRAKT